MNKWGKNVALLVVVSSCVGSVFANGNPHGHSANVGQYGYGNQIGGINTQQTDSPGAQSGEFNLQQTQSIADTTTLQSGNKQIFVGSQIQSPKNGASGPNVANTISASSVVANQNYSTNTNN